MGEDLLRRISDEMEIRNLIARFAQISDVGSAEDYASCITEDSVWETTVGRGQIRRGLADCLAGLAQRRTPGKHHQGPGSNSRHAVSTTHVRLNGDEANAVSYVELIRDSATKPQLAMICTYTDEFRRTSDGWKLSKRVVALA